MRWLRSPWAALTISILICASYWRWAERVMVPANTAAVRRIGIPVGNNSDLYPRWLGSRELLLNGRNPYSDEVTRDIQRGFYGRPLDARNPNDPVKQEAFVYPLYVVFVMAPFVKMSFSAVYLIFRWGLLTAIALSLPLWVHAIGLRSRASIVIAGMFLVLSSSPAIVEYHQQNLAGLVVFLLAAAAAATSRGWLVVSGFLLALATIKPDFSTPLIVWFLFWAGCDWRSRQMVIWAFVATLSVLTAGAEMLLPHWFPMFIAAVRHYPDYGADSPLVRLFLPAAFADLVIALLLLGIAIVCWRWRNVSPGTEDFAWAPAWITAVTLVIIPKSAAYNQPLIIPALLLLIAKRREIFQNGRMARAMTKAVAVCLVWEWVTAFILAILSFFNLATRLAPLAQIPDYTSIALIPTCLLAVIAATMATWRGPQRS